MELRPEGAYPGTREFLRPNGRDESPAPRGRKRLLYYEVGPFGTLHVLPLMPSVTAEPRVPSQYFPTQQFPVQNGQSSPDGSWIANMSRESGQPEIYATPFSGPGGKRQISVRGGRQPRWRSDGKEMFCATPSGGRRGDAERHAQVGPAHTLFGGIILNRGMPYDVSADGQTFIVIQDDAGSADSRPELDDTAQVR
jgi:hypothetical protein